MRRTRLLLTLLAASAVSVAQQIPATSAPAATPAQTSAAIDPKLHADVVQLVELTGARQRMLAGLDKQIDEGKNSILKNGPNADPRFAEEWAKRMKARTNIDDYVAVFVSVYEKHFNDDEILELIQIQRDSNDGKTPTVSPKLREKASAIAVTLQSEIMGGCTQVGAKLGGEIGMEISKEHPDWDKAPAAPATPPAQP